MKVLVTGGAGFIGSALIRQILRLPRWSVVNYDCLTYAGDLETVHEVRNHTGYRFVRGDICDAATVRATLEREQPDGIIHLAAESHVDRSIDSPSDFIRTNIVGTYTLLEAALDYFRKLPADRAARFRFHHVSTDEVFGSLGATGEFREDTPYAPRSPYSASKAASDHLVNAWSHTFGLPVVLTNCSNNYGPFQFPEKLIPLMILNAIDRKPLPVYGDGSNVRDWLHVEDHARALVAVFERGRIGESYNVGGRSERSNLEVVKTICRILDERLGGQARHEDLITYVTDRKGHDWRYAIDCSKLERELGWAAQETFDSGLAKTVQWYLDNLAWCRRIQGQKYAGERLGVRRA